MSTNNTTDLQIDFEVTSQDGSVHSDLERDDFQDAIDNENDLGITFGDASQTSTGTQKTECDIVSDDSVFAVAYASQDSEQCDAEQYDSLDDSKRNDFFHDSGGDNSHQLPAHQSSNQNLFDPIENDDVSEGQASPTPILVEDSVATGSHEPNVCGETQVDSLNQMESPEAVGVSYGES